MTTLSKSTKTPIKKSNLLVGQLICLGCILSPRISVNSEKRFNCKHGRLGLTSQSVRQLPSLASTVPIAHQLGLVVQNKSQDELDKSSIKADTAYSLYVESVDWRESLSSKHLLASGLTAAVLVLWLKVLTLFGFTVESTYSTQSLSLQLLIAFFSHWGLTHLDRTYARKNYRYPRFLLIIPLKACLLYYWGAPLVGFLIFAWNYAAWTDKLQMFQPFIYTRPGVYINKVLSLDSALSAANEMEAAYAALGFDSAQLTRLHEVKASIIDALVADEYTKANYLLEQALQ